MELSQVSWVIVVQQNESGSFHPLMLHTFAFRSNHLFTPPCRGVHKAFCPYFWGTRTAIERFRFYFSAKTLSLQFTVIMRQADNKDMSEWHCETHEWWPGRLNTFASRLQWKCNVSLENTPVVSLLEIIISIPGWCDVVVMKDFLYWVGSSLNLF